MKTQLILIIYKNSWFNHSLKLKLVMLSPSFHLQLRVVLLLTIPAKQIKMHTLRRHTLWVSNIAISSQFVMVMGRMEEKSVDYWNIVSHSMLKAAWRNIWATMISLKIILKPSRFIKLCLMLLGLPRTKFQTWCWTPGIVVPHVYQ